MSTASFFCSSGEEDRANMSLSCSILASSAQPNQPPFLPRPPIEKLTTGFITSAATQLVKNMFQPPSLTGFWLVRRVPPGWHSVGRTPTFEAGGAKLLRHHDRLRLQRHHVAGRHDHNRRSVIAGFGDGLLGRFDIAGL